MILITSAVLRLHNPGSSKKMTRPTTHSNGSGTERRQARPLYGGMVLATTPVAQGWLRHAVRAIGQLRLRWPGLWSGRCRRRGRSAGPPCSGPAAGLMVLAGPTATRRESGASGERSPRDTETRFLREARSPRHADQIRALHARPSGRAAG